MLTPILDPSMQSALPFRRASLSLGISLAVVALGLAAVPAGADTTVMLADGKTLENVTLAPASGKDQVVLRQEGQEPRTLSIQDLLVVDFGKVPGRPLTPSVRFINGDTVFGKVTFPNSRQVKVAAGWGSITAPLTWVSAIRLQDKAALPGPVQRDTVVLANDRVEGTIEGVAGGKVTVNLGGTSAPTMLATARCSRSTWAAESE
jgi:hypothetical protein